MLNGGCWRAWGEREWGTGWGGGWGGKDTEVEVIHLFCLAQATIGVYVVFLRLLFAAGRSHSRDRRVTPFSFAVPSSFLVLFLIRDVNPQRNNSPRCAKRIAYRLLVREAQSHSCDYDGSNLLRVTNGTTLLAAGSVVCVLFNCRHIGAQYSNHKKPSGGREETCFP